MSPKNVTAASRELTKRVKRRFEEVDRVLRLIGSTTELLLHDVRNHFLPLVGYVDIVASNQKSAEPFHNNIHEILGACRTFDLTLKRLAAFGNGSGAPASWTRTAFALERTARLLRCWYGRELDVRVDCRSASREIEVDHAALVRCLMAVVACVLENRGSCPGISLTAADVPGRQRLEIGVEVRGSGGDDETTTRSLLAACLRSALEWTDVGTVVTTSDDGARCRFEVPAAAGNPTQNISPDETLARPGESLLVVSNEPISRDLTRSYLSAKGFRVSVTAVLTDAVQILKAEPPPTAVLLDVTVQPPEQITLVVQAALHARVAGMVISCPPHRADEMRRLGACALLVRPFRLPELVRSLRSAIDGSNQNTSNLPSS